MTYQQTLNYLYTKLPMFSRIGAAAYKADLNNTIAICEALDNPQTKFKTVHITGTNGKGSTSHMLAAIFQAAGYKTGLYTSPHLKDFRERIKINGEKIKQPFVADFVERIMPLINQYEPSFFEITVAMAFEYFEEQKVEIAIIEVGLGGRLDSTNVIYPQLSVITNIGWDHMNILGGSLKEIAFEKAGIIKKEVPVVIGEVLPETREVFEKKAFEENSELIIASEHLYVSDWHLKQQGLIIMVAEKISGERKNYQLDLQGIYQLKNLITVLQAVKQLQKLGWNLTEFAIDRGLQQVKKLTGLHGRWEIVHEQPTIVLDVAHNEDGIKMVVEQLEITDHEELHIVIGLVKDKEIEKVLALLPILAKYYFTKAPIPRALPEEILAAKASELGLKGNSYPFVNSALQAALTHAKKKDLILVCGSVFIVGEVDARIYKNHL